MAVGARESLEKCASFRGPLAHSLQVSPSAGRANGRRKCEEACPSSDAAMGRSLLDGAPLSPPDECGSIGAAFRSALVDLGRAGALSGGCATLLQRLRPAAPGLDGSDGVGQVISFAARVPQIGRQRRSLALPGSGLRRRHCRSQSCSGRARVPNLAHTQAQI